MAASSSAPPALAPALAATSSASSSAPPALVASGARVARRPPRPARRVASKVVASEADFGVMYAKLTRDEDCFVVPTPLPGVEGAADYIDMQISSMRPCVYKIGITRDPHHRFYNDDHGYIHDGYTCMHLLIASSPYNCARLEEQLIGHFFEKPGCYNMAKGGENPPPEGLPCFTYLVTAKADERWGEFYKRRSKRSRP